MAMQTFPSEVNMSVFEDVKNFMTACDQGKSEQTATLYLELINEEMNELSDGVEGGSDVATLDAICDTIWTLIGYAHAKGYPIETAWDAVALSNLRKIDLRTGKVNRRADGKVLKPEGWKPPDIGRILDDAGFQC
jgi:predicted HAD superfamily Cof-like phosphohydrolase